MEIDFFEMTFGYSQLAVFNAGLANPFNSWQSRHYAQGFSWRPGSVSFRLFDEFGSLDVGVLSSSQVQVKSDTKRAILVPFSVARIGAIGIASVDQTEKHVPMPNGEYALAFEAGVTDDGRMWCHLTFVPSTAVVTPNILRADPDLSPRGPLLMEAQPA